MKTVKYVRPPLYPKQREAVFNDARYSLVEASTKSGKTYSALAWLTEQALVYGRPGRHYWWIAPIYGQARIAYQRLRRALPREYQRARDTDQTIVLANGATLWFKSGEHPDALYGEDVYAVVIDEASRVREDAWHAVRSTLTATQGPARMIGNVKGRRNWFYRMARRAEAGELNMQYARITAYDAVEAGVLDVTEIEDARRQLPDAIWRELYLAEASDDDGNPFGLEAIRGCIAPLSDDEPVAFGVDLAKSVDWTVIVGLNAAGAVCRLERFQSPWQETIARVARTIGDTPTLVDSTGVGDPVLEALQRGGDTRAIGFQFTAKSKQQLMEGLAVAIQTGAVRYPEGAIVLELEAFEYVYTRTGVRYSGMDGSHDDCVCALALAVEQAGRPGRRRPRIAAPKLVTLRG